MNSCDVRGDYVDWHGNEQVFASSVLAVSDRQAAEIARDCVQSLSRKALRVHTEDADGSTFTEMDEPYVADMFNYDEFPF